MDKRLLDLKEQHAIHLKWSEYYKDDVRGERDIKKLHKVQKEIDKIISEKETNLQLQKERQDLIKRAKTILKKNEEFVVFNRLRMKNYKNAIEKANRGDTEDLEFWTPIHEKTYPKEKARIQADIDKSKIKLEQRIEKAIKGKSKQDIINEIAKIQKRYDILYERHKKVLGTGRTQRRASLQNEMPKIAEQKAFLEYDVLENFEEYKKNELNKRAKTDKIETTKWFLKDQKTNRPVTFYNEISIIPKKKEQKAFWERALIQEFKIDGKTKYNAYYNYTFLQDRELGSSISENAKSFDTKKEALDFIKNEFKKPIVISESGNLIGSFLEREKGIRMDDRVDINLAHDIDKIFGNENNVIFKGDSDKIKRKKLKSVKSIRKISAEQWSKTHKDYRLIKSDGSKWILTNKEGATILEPVEVIKKKSTKPKKQSIKQRYFRQDIFSSSDCQKGTFKRRATDLKGVEVMQCKLKSCVNEKGSKACNLVDQSNLYDKKVFKMKGDNFIRKNKGN